MRGKYSVKTDLCTDVEIDIAGLEEYVKTLAHVLLIYAGPHLPLDAVVQIRFKLHTRPGRCNAVASTDPTGQFSYGVREAALPWNRMTPEPHGSDSVRCDFHQR